jgi:uncharacterized membrane protein SpoIIM required for sporulation
LAFQAAGQPPWFPRLADVDVQDLTSVQDTLKVIVGRRWILISVLFFFELAVILYVSNSSFLPSELGTYENQYNTTSHILNQSAVGQVISIFANNFRVATVELVPGLGLAVFGLSLYATARVVEVIAIVKNVPVGIALGTLFFLPSTWLELPAYAIAAAESIYLAYSIYIGFRKGWARFVREIRFLLVNIILIAGVLIVAATFEVTEIQFEQGPVQTQALAFLTWIPFVAVFALEVRYWRKARREAPAIEEREAEELSQSAGALQDVGGQPPPQGGKEGPGGPVSSGEDGGTTA